MADPAVRVLFVCTGNICRSPTAEGVLRKLVADAALDGRVLVESAGTTGYHVGEAPDSRAQAAARRRGYDLSSIRARRVTAPWVAEVDYVLAMDRGHLAALHRLAGARTRGIGLFLDYAPTAEAREVPDPYYGAGDGFERVLDLIEAGAEGLLAEIRGRLAGDGDDGRRR